MDGSASSGLVSEIRVLLAGTSLAVQPLIAPATMSQSGVCPVQKFASESSQSMLKIAGRESFTAIIDVVCCAPFSTKARLAE